MIRTFAAIGATLLAAVPLHAAERAFTVSNFTELEVAGPYNVTVATGRGITVRARGEQSDLDGMRVVVSDGKLQIGPRNSQWKMWRNLKPVDVRVTVPALRAAGLAGSGDVSVDRVRGDEFSGVVAGSGDLTIGAVEARSITLSVAGSGGITAAGRCVGADLSIAGTGNIVAGNLRCQATEVSIVGSGDAAIHASKRADVSIMGSGNVTVTGGAKCDVSKLGRGQVRCGS